ncbi:MAG: alpha/beta hydrolase [Pseudomonadota bacterium]|nr:alpha/beta hydrolase [Alphaproteobacteria bacterium]MEE3322825.1 alpha/beta hydrolase [Pseudomonadota bacterium]
MNLAETVILLHGIGHTSIHMHGVERTLKAQGYIVFNVTYPSLQMDIESLARWLDYKLEALNIWTVSDKVHFVTHSMGGLVCGCYLEHALTFIPKHKMGRVVMLGTPHGGSEIADKLKNFWLYKLIFGPAGQQLTTDARSNMQLTPNYELGIIAGTRNWLYPMGRILIKRPHDGCVSVESTKLRGMKDHIILPTLHGFMGWSSKIHTHIIYFLQNGVFTHEI